MMLDIIIQFSTTPLLIPAISIFNYKQYVMFRFCEFGIQEVAQR